MLLAFFHFYRLAPVEHGGLEEEELAIETQGFEFVDEVHG